MFRPGIAYERAEDHPSVYSKDAVDTLASEIAVGLRLKPAGDLLKVISDIGGRVHYVNPFVDGTHEDTIFVHGPRDFDIYLSLVTSPARDRFTAAHELGHYILHSKSGETPLVAARRGTGRAEWEANWFAAGLLMPKSEFQKRSKQYNGSVTSLASYFGVSPLAAKVRAESLGI